MNDRLTQSDIDKMQKEAIQLINENSCNTCIFSPMFNTKPIAVYTCNGRLAVPTTLDGETTANFFRVENINGDDTVVLRLLTLEDGALTCTPNTITIKISCICGIQCFDSINCTLCGDVQ
jgi:hypothetical protein